MIHPVTTITVTVIMTITMTVIMTMPVYIVYVNAIHLFNQISVTAASPHRDSLCFINIHESET